MSGLRRIVSAVTRPRGNEQKPLFPKETFVGPYAGGKFAGAELIKGFTGNSMLSSQQIIGYRIRRVTRGGRTNYGKDRITGARFNNTLLVDDLNNPGTIGYVRRVEKITGRVKAVAAAVGSTLLGAVIAKAVFGGDVPLATDVMSQAVVVLSDTAQNSLLPTPAETVQTSV